MKIRTAIIPAAGMGTRFLPATKVVPKELIPIIDKPGIQYAVEEIMSVGIENIIIVTASGKESILEYFEQSQSKGNSISSEGKFAQIAQLDQIAKTVRIKSVLQTEQLGLGHAIACASEEIRDEPFAVVLPDDLIFGPKPALQQLLDIFHTHESSILAVQNVGSENISKYGVIDPTQVDGNVLRVGNAIEKPAPEEAPSSYGIIGRYNFTPGILERLSEAKPGAIGEIQLTDAIADLTKYESVYALDIDGKRHDVGTPLGMLKAAIEIGISREDIGQDLSNYIKKL